MNILYIHSTALAPANGENIRGNYLLEQLSGNHRIDLVTPGCVREFPESVTVYPVGNVSRFGSNKELKYIYFGVRSSLLHGRLRGDYDVVYCFGIAGTVLARKYAGKTRLIYDFYEVDFPELMTPAKPFLKPVFKMAGRYQRRILGKADLLLLLTREMEEYARPLTAARTCTVYDAADREMFHPGGAEHEPFTVIFHGGILERDNVLNLIRAVEQVAEQAPLRLVVAGQGPALEECREYVRGRPALDDVVHFTGWVDYEKMPGYLAGADLAVIPCSRERINDMIIPRKAYEYMNCGIPVVMTRLKAAAELFSDDELIFLDDTGPATIAGKITQCMRDRPGLERRSKLLAEKGERLNLQSECARIIAMIEGEPPPAG